MWRNSKLGLSPVAPASSPRSTQGAWESRRQPEDPCRDERDAWLALYGPQTRGRDVTPLGTVRGAHTFRYVDIDIECLREGTPA